MSPPSSKKEVTAPCWRFCEVILCNGSQATFSPPQHVQDKQQEIFFYRVTTVSFHTCYFFENDVCATRFVISAKNITVLDETL